MQRSTTTFDQAADAHRAVQADDDSDLTREFWGDGAGWVTSDRSAQTDVTGRQARTAVGPGHQARTGGIPRDRRRTSAFQVQPPNDADEFRLDHTPTSLAAIRDGFAAFRPKRVQRDDSTGPIDRTREHGIVRSGATARPPAASDPRRARRPSPASLPHRDATIAQLAAGQHGNGPIAPPEIPDEERVALTPIERVQQRWLGLDPMTVRILIIALAVIVAIPLALALRSGAQPPVGSDRTDEVPAFAPLVEPAADPSASVAPASAATDPAGNAAVTATDEPAAPAQDAAGVDAAPDEGDATPPTEVEVNEASDESTADLNASDDGQSTASAARHTESIADEVHDCSLTYTAAAGDSWYRMADEAGVSPGELTKSNGATIRSVILPGDEICLPAGATVPSPPTTVAASPAPTTAAAATGSTSATATPTTTTPTTTAPTTAASTTTAPTTTSAPTTTTAPPRRATTSQVQDMIREIWPEELHDKALDVARRESSYVATADNGWCCVGVFQIYWTVHRNWLDQYGIHTRDDLKDARKNVLAAYDLYQRNGWGPWGG